MRRNCFLPHTANCGWTWRGKLPRRVLYSAPETAPNMHLKNRQEASGKWPRSARAGPCGTGRGRRGKPRKPSWKTDGGLQPVWSRPCAGVLSTLRVAALNCTRTLRKGSGGCRSRRAPAGRRGGVSHLAWPVLPAARVSSVTVGAVEQGWPWNDWEHPETARARRTQSNDLGAPGGHASTEEPEQPVKERLCSHTGPPSVRHWGDDRSRRT